jgi:hypothetical protein
MDDFETKLAAAGELFEKLASEQGISINDFSDEEAADILTQIMEGGESSGSEMSEEPKVAHQYQDEPVYVQDETAAQLLYAQAFQEVTKQAAAANIDVTSVDPQELHNAVLQQASLMTDPTYQSKVAALNEKVAEADMLGRIMAHSYVDELAKLAAQAEESSEEEKKDEDEEKKEKKAAFVASLRGSSEAEKRASLVAARVQAHLVAQGIDPFTGEKLAGAEEIDAAAMSVLKEKGWV